MTSTSESFDLRVGGIFLIFALSIIGFYLPAIFKQYMGIKNVQQDTNFMLLKSFASGIILGVAMLHLLVEAVAELGEYTEYPRKLTAQYFTRFCRNC